MNFRSAITLLIFLLFPIVAPAVEYTDQQDALRMLNRLERLERDLGLLQREVYTGDAPRQPPVNMSSPLPEGGNGLAPLNARLDEIEARMRELNGKVEQAEFSTSRLAEKLEKITADYEYRFSELEKQEGTSPAPEAESGERAEPGETTAEESKWSETNPSHTLGTLPVKRQAPDAADASDAEAEKDISETKASTPQEQYNSAFSLLRANQYAEAETAFTQFIEENPKNLLAGSAYYWLGETHYAQKAYDKAAIQFLKSYKNFPKGKKAPESLLKLAMSLEKLKKRKEACTTLGKLNEEYPSVSSALKQKAAETAARLGCK